MGNISIIPIAVGPLIFIVSGCSSYESRLENDPQVGDGIVYYMPIRPIKVTVAIDATTGKYTSTIEDGVTVADSSHRFLLSYSQNLVGTNHMNITVNSQGLLESSNADTTSHVVDIVKNVATTAGDIAGLAPAAPPVPGAPAPPKPPQPKGGCQLGQTYTILVFPEDRGASICGIEVLVEPASPSAARLGDPRPASVVGTDFRSGIYYKTDIPYKVTMIDLNKKKHEEIHLSPDESPVIFQPITRTLFADNKVTVVLSDGVLKSVEQSSDGELVGLSALPPAAMSSYLGAVGNVLSAVGTNVNDQKALIADRESLAVARVKSQVCQSTIAANPVATKSGDQLKAAVNNITAACQ
jgi:hypothetical protein